MSPKDVNNTGGNKKEAVETPNTEISTQDDTSTRRFVLLMASLTIAIVVIGAIVIYWLAGRYVAQTNKNKAQDQTITLTKQKKENLELLRPNYNNITSKGSNGKSDADLILNAMPVDEGYNQLIAMLERMGQESGVQVGSVSKSTQADTTASPTSSPIVPSGPNVKSYQISLTAEGNFNNILEFVKKTENSSRVLDFVNVSLSGPAQSNKISASMSFKVYWQGPANINPTEKELQ